MRWLAGQQELPKYEQVSSLEQVAIVEVPPFGDLVHKNEVQRRMHV
jgi:hypothetical protein